MAGIERSNSTPSRGPSSVAEPAAGAGAGAGAQASGAASTGRKRTADSALTPRSGSGALQDTALSRAPRSAHPHVAQPSAASGAGPSTAAHAQAGLGEPLALDDPIANAPFDEADAVQLQALLSGDDAEPHAAGAGEPARPSTPDFVVDGDGGRLQPRDPSVFSSATAQSRFHAAMGNLQALSAGYEDPDSKTLAAVHALYAKLAPTIAGDLDPGFKAAAMTGLMYHELYGATGDIHFPAQGESSKRANLGALKQGVLAEYNARRMGAGDDAARQIREMNPRVISQAAHIARLPLADQRLLSSMHPEGLSTAPVLAQGRQAADLRRTTMALADCWSQERRAQLQANPQHPPAESLADHVSQLISNGVTGDQLAQALQSMANRHKETVGISNADMVQMRISTLRAIEDALTPDAAP
jgi:hypothetical protein